MLQQEAFEEVYLCGLPHTQERWLQGAVGVCETFGVPFALPAYTVRLGRAQPVANKAVAAGFLHYVTASGKAEYRMVKRFLDIAGSATALWALFRFTGGFHAREAQPPGPSSSVRCGSDCTGRSSTC